MVDIAVAMAAALVAVIWFAVGSLVARRAYRWHRDRDRARSISFGLALLAGLFWPWSLAWWDLDWAISGRDRRRHQRPSDAEAQQPQASAVQMGLGTIITAGGLYFLAEHSLVSDNGSLLDRLGLVALAALGLGLAVMLRGFSRRSH